MNLKSQMLNEGDLVFINNVHLWEMVEMEGNSSARIYKTAASILYPHSTKENWYYVFLHKPVKNAYNYYDPGLLIWTGWVYLTEERWEEGLFEVCVG